MIGGFIEVGGTIAGVSLATTGWRIGMIGTTGIGVRTGGSGTGTLPERTGEGRLMKMASSMVKRSARMGIIISP